MNLSKLLNQYCRKIGPILMVVLPLIILNFMILGNFAPNSTEMLIATTLWILLFLNSFAYLINAILIKIAFKRETKKKAEEGFPIDSLEGFSSVTTFTNRVFLSSAVIAVVIFFSLLIILAVMSVIPFIQDNEEINGMVDELIKIDFATLSKNYLRPVLLGSAIGLVLIAIGILLILEIPEKPSFEVGAFLKYYYPKQSPLILDNLLSDAVLAFIDPITKMNFDEWTNTIKQSLNNNFEVNCDNTTRMERAREKILLLFYLRMRMPKLLPKDGFKRELLEVIHEDKYKSFKKGKGSGISFDVLEEIFERLLKRIPEIFMTIDRLVIELTENLEEFNDNNDLWVNVSAPEKVVGNENPFRILVFTLNKNSKDFGMQKRNVDFHLTSPQSNFMENLDINLALDEAEEFNTTATKLQFISEGDNDILNMLTRILQIGDAVWFTVERRSFKSHLFNVTITENKRGSIFGETLTIDVTRDLMYYIRTYGGKLSALSGVLVPVGSIILAAL